MKEKNDGKKNGTGILKTLKKFHSNIEKLDKGFDRILQAIESGNEKKPSKQIFSEKN